MEKYLNSDENFEETVRPQTGTENFEEAVPPQQGAEEQREAAPPDVNDMSAAEFGAYIDGLKNGNTQVSESPAKETSEPEKPEEKEEKPFRAFATEAEFQGFMNKVMGERLKSVREEKEKYTSLAKRAADYYGTDPDAAVDALFADLDEQAATASGQTLEEYKAQQQLLRDAENWQNMQKQQEQREQIIAQIQQQWQQESEQLKSVIPDFDFEKAMENDDFRTLVLDKQLSVAAAYITLTNSAAKAAQPKRAPIHEAARFASKPANPDSVNPLAMSDSDFLNYCQKIKDRG